MDQHQKRDPKGDGSAGPAPAWTGGSDKGCLIPGKQQLPEQQFGCGEHALFTQTREPSMVNILSEMSKEQNIFSDYYYISLRRLVCHILEGTRSLILIK